MADTPVNGVGNTSVLDQLAIKNTTSKNAKQLDKNAFLELMVAQLKHQDPLSPQDNAQFVSQLAQFSSLEGVQNLNTSMSSMASSMSSSQALQASALVGRQVHVKGDVASLGSEGGITVIASLERSTPALSMRIENGNGEVLQRVQLGQHAAGDQPLTWDGMSAANTRLPPGNYRVVVESMLDGKAEQQPVYVPANVDSVTFGKNGDLALNLDTTATVTISDIKRIGR